MQDHYQQTKNLLASYSDKALGVLLMSETPPSRALITAPPSCCVGCRRGTAR
jgi:hypothetical protein